jgi:benzoylformate decarboxylase
MSSRTYAITTKPPATSEARQGVALFVDQLIAEGVTRVFGNPGTTEQAFVQAISQAAEIEYVGTTHESVAVGMADGYARATGEPALVQLHASPGLGNAMGLIYDAAVGKTPLVVYVGEPDAELTLSEPILAGDSLAMAAPFAKWTHRVSRPSSLQDAVRRAFKVAAEPPGGVVVLSIPADVLDVYVEDPVPAVSLRVPWRVGPDPEAITRLGEAIRAAEAPVVLVGDGAVAAGAGAEAARLAEAIAAPIYEVWTSEVALSSELSLGVLNLLSPDSVRRSLEPYDLIVAVGCSLFPLLSRPAAPLIRDDQVLAELHFDGWELGKNQRASVLVMGDLTRSLQAVRTNLEEFPGASDEELGVRREAIVGHRDGVGRARSRKWARGEAGESGDGLTRGELVDGIAAALEPGDIVFDEAITLSGALRAGVAPICSRYFLARGGGLGQGMASPLGVKLALPEGRLLTVVGDGSALYTIQSLWTAARYGIAVGYLIVNNGRYHILDRNLADYLGEVVDETAFDLRPPTTSFAELAAAFGVANARVESAAALAPTLTAMLARDVPFLVDVTVKSPLPGPIGSS